MTRHDRLMADVGAFLADLSKTRPSMKRVRVNNLALHTLRIVEQT